MEIRDDGSTAGFSAVTRESVAQEALRPPVAVLPALTVLCHPDLGRIGDRVILGELASSREALLSRRRPRFSAPGAGQGKPLADPFLSRRPLRFEPLEGGGVRLAATGCRIRVIADGVEVTESHALSPDQIDAGVVLELAQRIVLLLHRLPRPPAELPESCGLVGDSAGMLEVRQAIGRVAALDVPVLIRGETGTGKELVARALHGQSPRHGGPFVSVNLGALPPTLAAAELFGARKGAYTGAERNRPGYFARADGGTLFLDEIGAAPQELQAMLLRVLETREVLPVGSQTPRRVDVRILSATDADLDSLSRDGTFRAPLLHRLAGYSVRLPPLRRRRDDLGRLLVHFLDLERSTAGAPVPPGDPKATVPWLPAALVARLARYSWPGNVRQLRNVVRQLLIDSRGQPSLGAGSRLDELLPEPAPPIAEAGGEEPPAAEAPAMVEPAPLRARRKPSEVTEEELLSALRARRFELKATADALGISRTSLYALLERSPNVRAAADVPPEEIRQAFERHGGELGDMVTELEISERALRQRLKDLGLR